MDEDISDEEIGPSSVLRKAVVPEPKVNEHVRVTTPDEVEGVKRERLIIPEEERVPSPLEQRVPSYSDVTARLGWLTARLRHLADQKWL